MNLSYPPPWQDMQTLCAHICASESTVNVWVKTGILPPPRKRGGKLMWKWTEVERHLEGGAPGVAPSADAQAEQIREASRALANSKGH